MAKLKELKAQFGEGTPAPANGPTPVKGGGGASGTRAAGGAPFKRSDLSRV